MSSLIEARTAPIRLEFAITVFWRPRLKSNDSRRWQNKSHLKTSLGYLHTIVDCQAGTGIRKYRISSEIAPYVTHPDMPRFHREIEESAAELAALGGRIPRRDILVMLETK